MRPAHSATRRSSTRFAAQSWSFHPIRTSSRWPSGLGGESWRRGRNVRNVGNERKKRKRGTEVTPSVARACPEPSSEGGPKQRHLQQRFHRSGPADPAFSPRPPARWHSSLGFSSGGLPIGRSRLPDRGASPCSHSRIRATPPTRTSPTV